MKNHTKIIKSVSKNNEKSYKINKTRLKKNKLRLKIKETFVQNDKIIKTILLILLK